ncbi:MAG: amidase [Rhodospirillales bacterium]|nr:MAG: amidase [Rhodospirillales bacterium]
MTGAIHELTLAGLASGLRAKRFSSREIVDALLARIDKADGRLHAFNEVYASEARALADGADKARAAGLPLGPLHGLPIAIKDLCDIAGRVGTGGSVMFAERVATETSTTVERLLAAGMIPLGKTHMVEFALGGWGTNPLMGAPWNPWDLATHRVPGGSSSGTGVAVAARLAPAGIGSDTGGSVRIPCAFTGLTGVKVTHGRIGLHGTMLLSHTLDTIGPMARSVEDCALLLQALAGPDPRDAATLSAPPPADYMAAVAPGARVKGARVAMPDAAQLPEFMKPDAVEAWRAAAATLRGIGVNVVETRLPDWYFDVAAMSGTVSSTEAYVHHQAYIGDMDKPIGEAVRRRVLSARNFTPWQYADAMFAMTGRRRAMAAWFEAYDAILLPTMATTAIPLAEVDEASPLPGYLTRPANFLGLCAVSLPAGLSGGLPLGVQIVGKPFAETMVLRLGKAFQDATDHHRAAPDLAALGL